MVKLMLTSIPTPMSSLESLFCHIDDFCKCFEPQWKKRLLSKGKTTYWRDAFPELPSYQRFIDQ